MSRGRGVAAALTLIVALAPATDADAVTPVTCDGSAATIVGTPDADVLHGTPGDDVIHGRGGNDIIRGHGGNDLICGGGGDDVVRGGAGEDVIFGDGGIDQLRGGSGADVLFGGSGGDELRGVAGTDALFGGPGADLLRGGADSDACFGQAGGDERRSCKSAATANGDILVAGEQLLAGQMLESANGKYRLAVHRDGNVVLADDLRDLWDTDTSGHPGARLVLSDGNLSVVLRGAVIWESATSGSVAKLKNNADLVVGDSSGDVLWSRRDHPGVPDWHLPWAIGVAWEAGAPHGTNLGSLDFGPGDGVGEVRAVASGTVGWFECNSGGRYLKIEHGDGWMSTYYHLEQIRTELIGDWVEAGTVLGIAGNAVPCGGQSTFDHVHLVLWHNGERLTADGRSMRGYTVHAGYQDYWGTWIDDSSGATIIVNRGGAECCLLNSG